MNLRTDIFLFMVGRVIAMCIFCYSCILKVYFVFRIKIFRRDQDFLYELMLELINIFFTGEVFISFGFTVVEYSRQYENLIV